MSSELEPIRWLDPTSEVSTELRAALEAARAELPSSEALGRIELGAAAKAAAAGKLGLIVKLLVGLTVVGAAALQFWPKELSAPVVAPPEPSAPTPASATGPEEPAAPETPAAESTTPRTEPAEPSTSRPVPARPKAAPSPPAPDELELLESAQRSLARDPAEALRLAELSARYHPSGDFVPEREALAIQALLGLGRRAEAQARFERLERRHPRSAVLSRLEELLRAAE